MPAHCTELIKFVIVGKRGVYMTKKYFLLLSVIAVLCCGCTSKEQDQKIKLFWLQQFAGVSMKALANSDK